MYGCIGRLKTFLDLSNAIETCVENGVQDIYQIMKVGYKAACKSLKETPEKLKILKKAGVVDAGAQGFVDFLCKDGDGRSRIRRPLRG